MAVNVGAVILFELFDADTQITATTKAAQFEVVRDTLTDILAAKKSLSRELRPKMRRVLVEQIVERFGAEYFMNEKNKGNPASVDDLLTKLWVQEPVNQNGNNHHEPVLNMDTVTAAQLQEALKAAQPVPESTGPKNA